MPTCIALLRGINVGGRNQLPMKELVAVMESLGYAGVRTYIQSGNAVFDSPKTPDRKDAKVLSAAIEASRGFAPDVMLFDSAHLADAIADNPFPADDGKALHCFFLKDSPPEPNLGKLSTLKTGNEDFALKEHCFYLYAPDGIGRSKLAATAEKCLGVPVTARNWTTVLKLAEMAGLH